jgi:hypothetical protein
MCGGLLMGREMQRIGSREAMPLLRFAEAHRRNSKEAAAA